MTGKVKSCLGEKQITLQVPEADWLRNNPVSSPAGAPPLGIIAAKSLVKT
jgi:hypothetical protein